MISYLELSAFKLDQLTYKRIFISKIKFTDLIKIVKFTSRESVKFDPFDKKNKKETTEPINQYYQRVLNDDRTRGIELFLLKEMNKMINEDSVFVPMGLFPTSMLIAFKHNLEFNVKSEYIKYLNRLKENSNDEEIGIFIDSNSDNHLYNIFIPEINDGLVVDGQHRLAGMKQLYEDALNKNIKIGRKSIQAVYPNLSYSKIIEEINSFEFNCIILVDFDIWEQGKVFADVNFNQKPVNKSLYYDIFGSFPDPEKNEIYLAHMLTMHLNTNNDSVLKNRIKMLGAGDGLISQAFFVERLLPLFREKGIWNNLPQDFIKGGEEHLFLPKFFKSYFLVVMDTFKKYWPKEDQNSPWAYKGVLLKTNGIGALLRLVNDVVEVLNDRKIDLSKVKTDKLKEELVEIIGPLSKYSDNYFSPSGEYGQGGSAGFQTKLYNEMSKDLMKELKK